MQGQVSFLPLWGFTPAGTLLLSSAGLRVSLPEANDVAAQKCGRVRICASTRLMMAPLEAGA